MRLKRENTAGNIILDHRSMALTSVRSGILIFSCEERLRSRAFLGCAFRSRLCRRGPLAFLYWIPELSNITGVEFLTSLTLVVISFPATSLWISSVVSRMFPWESTCGGKEQNQHGSDVSSQWSTMKPWIYNRDFFLQTKHITQVSVNKNAECSNPNISSSACYEL